MSILNILFIYIGLLFLPISYVTANDLWRFKVFYDDMEIGEHVFYLTSDKEYQKINVEADFNVDVFFINAFKYKHRNNEVWRGECLISIDASTNDDGEKYYVKGKKEKGVFSLITKDGEEKVDGCVKTFAYWDSSFLESDSLLNSQTGEIVDVDIVFVASEEIMVREKKIKANKYSLKSDDFVMELWYSEKNEWVALNSRTNDGAMLRYKIQ